MDLELLGDGSWGDINAAQAAVQSLHSQWQASSSTGFNPCPWKSCRCCPDNFKEGRHVPRPASLVDKVCDD